MVIPYEFIRAFEKKQRPEIPGEYPKDKMKYLLQPGHMEGLYLGQCLDACRWGSETTVMWDTGIEGMIKFITSWMSQNNDYKNLFHEKKIKELYKKFELPFIHYDKCPRDKKHKNTGFYSDGTVRCVEQMNRQWIKPSEVICSMYYDNLAQCEKPIYTRNERVCTNDLTNENEGPGSEAADEIHEAFSEVCFAIVSEKEGIMPLELVLMRLDIRHKKQPYNPCNASSVNQYEVPMDGWALASYVEKWCGQCTNPPVFGKKLIKKDLPDTEDYVIYRKK